MKRSLLLTLGVVLGLGALVSMAWVGISHASSIRAGEITTVRSNEIVDGSLYAAGNNIAIAGTVKGDVYCAGMNISVTGTIEGDVICAGSTVNINGKVLGDVRAAGQDITLGGDISGSVTAAGRTLLLNQSAKVGRDATLGGTKVIVDGKIVRDLVSGADSITVSGQVGRDVSAQVNSLQFDSTAKVGGNVSYSGPSPLVKADGAAISGTTNYTPQQREERQQSTGFAVQLWTMFFMFISTVIIGVVAVLVLPRAADAVGLAARTRSIASFASGAAAAIVVPIVSIFLMITVFGIPLAALLILGTMTGFVASLTVASYAIGWVLVERLNWPKRGRRLGSVILGSLALSLVGLIPLLGPIIVIVAIFVGFGAIVVAAVTRHPAQQKRVAAKKLATQGKA